MVQNPPEGMPRITPYLFYDDVDKALAWLTKTFGFTERLKMPGPDGKTMHAEMSLADAVVMMGQATKESGSISPANLAGVNASFYVYVNDVDAHYVHSKNSGAEIVSDLEEMFWGDKMYMAKDLEGQYWSFAQHVKDVAPEDMRPDF